MENNESKTIKENENGDSTNIEVEINNKEPHDINSSIIGLLNNKPTWFSNVSLIMILVLIYHLLDSFVFGYNIYLRVLVYGIFALIMYFYLHMDWRGVLVIYATTILLGLIILYNNNLIFIVFLTNPFFWALLFSHDLSKFSNIMRILAIFTIIFLVIFFLIIPILRNFSFLKIGKHRINISPKKVVQNIGDAFNGFVKGVGDGFDYIICSATGTCQGEKDQESEDIGVEIESFKPVFNNIYEGDNLEYVSIFRVKTPYNKELKFNFKCCLDNNCDIQAQPESHIAFRKARFSVYCDYKELKSGSHTAKIISNFKGSAYAYLKLFFVKSEELNKKMMNNPDYNFFSDIGVEQQDYAIMKYSKGPISIVSNSYELPIPISKERSFNFMFHIKNDWQGKIKKINSIQVIIPKDLEFSSSFYEFKEQSNDQNNNKIYSLDESKINELNEKNKVNNIDITGKITINNFDDYFLIKTIRIKVDYVYEIIQKDVFNVKKLKDENNEKDEKTKPKDEQEIKDKTTSENKKTQEETTDIQKEEETKENIDNKINCFDECSKDKNKINENCKNFCDCFNNCLNENSAVYYVRDFCEEKCKDKIIKSKEQNR